MIKGKTIEEAAQITNKEVVEKLGGLPAIKIHCSVLAEQAIKAAIVSYCEKNSINPATIPNLTKQTNACENCKKGKHL